jgi:hypothetical protein
MPHVLMSVDGSLVRPNDQVNRRAATDTRQAEAAYRRVRLNDGLGVTRAN